ALPSDTLDPTALAVLKFMLIRTFEMAGHFLFRDEIEDIAFSANEVWWGLTPAERRERRDPSAFQPFISGVIRNKLKDLLKTRAETIAISRLRSSDQEALSTELLQERDPDDKEPAEKLEELLERVTPCERAVLQLVSKGKSNKEVAEILEISEETVKTHRRNGLRRIRNNSRDKGLDS
ncbi:MAG TPA: sigma-70 family RNA polymerase sigma factor, partial [Gemmatimonadaceae bacterium]|nr:sigma-70 family RNA polymerase sigma factor [Gemmatimonadaceae bacterium]